MKVAILGYGRIGKAIHHFLEELKTDCVIDKYDKEYSPNIDHPLTTLALRRKYDLVISSMPYFENEYWAKEFIDAGSVWLDLGGHVGTSKNINDYARLRGCNFVGTDLGLAPGLINIYLEKFVKESKEPVKQAMIAVGGIPAVLNRNGNLLRYGITWSVDGLLNEYFDDCQIIKDGKICTVPGMSGLGFILDSGYSILECFHTSGGASHSIKSMMAKGLLDFSYKTIRYPGHCQTVQLLRKHTDVRKVLIEECPPQKDRVVLYCELNGTMELIKSIEAKPDMSAMQIATAKPVAHIIDGLLKKTIRPKNLIMTYEDYIPILEELQWQSSP